MHLDPFLYWLLAIPALVSTTVLADARLIYIDSGLGNTLRTTSIQIHADKVRTEEIGSGIYTLYDKGKQTLSTVNTQTGQYIATDLDKTRERAEKMLAIRTQLKVQWEQRIAQLPESQRQQARERLKQAEAEQNTPPPAIERKDAGKTGQIQGIPCQVSTILFNQIPVRELCNADQGILDQADYTVLLALFDYMDKMAAESARVQGMTPPPAEAGSASIHRPGLALRVQALPNGPRSELSAISKEVLDPRLFELPVDFKPFEPSDLPTAGTDHTSLHPSKF